MNARTIGQVAEALIAAGAVVRLVGPHVGLARAESGETLDADASFENSPSPLFDAAFVPDGDAGVDALCGNDLALEFVHNLFRHCKALMAVGAGRRLLERAGIPTDASDPALVISENAEGAALTRFIEAVAAHRNYQRESGPPPV